MESIMDEAYLWESELSAAQIAQLYNGRRRRLGLEEYFGPSNLKGAWALDDEEDGTSADGDTFIDMSGNPNDCTGDDGGDNSALTAKEGKISTYP